jgi:tetratricopeptide (TPR) repeat protein
MSSENKAHAVAKKGSTFECLNLWAFVGLRKVNKNGGSICVQATLKRLVGVALAIGVVIIGALGSAPSLAYEPGVFPGKGNKSAWKRATVPFNQGVDLAKAGDFAGAIAKYEDAIAIYPYNDGYFHNLGVVYARRGKPGDLLKAENAFRKATELCPTDWQNWNGLAGVLGNEKKYKECREAGLQTLKNNPPPERVAAMKATIDNLNRLLAQQK